MPAQPLATLLRGLRSHLEVSPLQFDAHTLGLGAASAIASRLPLVRRLPAGETWQQALTRRELTPRAPGTDMEKCHGIDQSVYFYFGAPAFPCGDVALLIDSRLLETVQCSFWPFDTGALEQHLRRDGTMGLTEEEQAAHFSGYWGEARSVAEFATEFIAAHFSVAIDYACREQKSVPDFPAYHALKSTDGDRRAWTIEVQAHAPVPLVGPTPYLQGIVVQRHTLMLDLPDDLSGLARVSADPAVGVREEIIALCKH